MQKQKTKKILKLVIPLLVIALGSGYLIKTMQAKEQEKLWQAVEQRKVKLQTKDIKKILYLTGKILPSSAISIYSPVSGQITDILVKEGDKVKANQKLFAVKQDSTGEKELEARRNEVDKAKLELSNAEDNLKRMINVKELFSVNEQVKNETEVDRKKMDYEAAKDRLALLEESLGIKEEKISKTKNNNLSTIFVTAPRASFVTLISKSIGDAVLGTTTGNQSTDSDVITLSDIDKMMVRSKVLESELELVKVGMPVQVKLDAIKTRVYAGKVSRISQQGVEDKSGGYTYFVTDISIDDKDENVRSQMNASIQIMVAEKKNVLALPVDSVATSGAHSVVEIIPAKNQALKADSPPVYKEIKVGLADEENIEILSNEFPAGSEFLRIDYAKIDPKKLAEGKIAEMAAGSTDKKTRMGPR